MRTSSPIVLLVAWLVSATVQAGGLAVKGGYQYGAGKDKGIHEAFIKFEHFVPLIPNVGLRRQWAANNQSTFTATDLLGYYELAESEALSLEIGGGVRRHSEAKKEDLSGIEQALKTMRMAKEFIPMGFAEGSFMFLGNIGVYGRVEGGSGNKVKFSHQEAGVAFKPLPIIRLHAGYRRHHLESTASHLTHPDLRNVSGFCGGIQAELGF